MNFDIIEYSKYHYENTFGKKNFNNLCKIYGLNDLSHDAYIIYVIGCGGTGGYFVRDASRLLMQCQNKYRNKLFKMVLIDGDVVEEKNINRQNFIYQDIGKNKASVLAERYSSLFQEISYIDSYVNSSQFLLDKIMFYEDSVYGDKRHIVFTFTDNLKSREYVDNIIRGSNILWIDVGNEDSYGQLVALEGIDGMISIKDVYKDFDELLQKERPSCADIPNLQTSAINILGASIANAYLYSLLLSDNTIYPNMIKFYLNGLSNSYYFVKSGGDDNA